MSFSLLQLLSVVQITVGGSMNTDNATHICVHGKHDQVYMILFVVIMGRHKAHGAA